jgi:hypothetical protein
VGALFCVHIRRTSPVLPMNRFGAYIFVAHPMLVHGHVRTRSTWRPPGQTSPGVAVALAKRSTPARYWL